MGLDTRGVMDGALRGFDMMERHYDRQDRKEYREQSLRQASADREENQRRYDQQQTRLRDLDNRNEQHYQDGLARQEKQDTQNQKVRDAQITASNKQGELADYQLNQNKKTAALTENMPLIQAQWDNLKAGRDVDMTLFDNEYIKGSAYDPRSYTNEKVAALRELKNVIPLALDGKLDLSDKRITGALNVVYKDLVQTGIGDVVTDPETGKTKKIVSKKINYVGVAPPGKGNENGDNLWMGVEVTYDDGTTSSEPITENRGTDPNDKPKLIPAAQGLQDIGEQLKMANTLYASSAYDRLFTTDEQRKSVRQEEKDYRKVVLEYQLSVNKQVEKGEISSEQGAAMLKSGIATISKAYGREVESEPKPAPLNQWAGDDKSKQQFIAALQQQGQDLSQATPAHLDTAYQAVIEKTKSSQDQLTANALRASYAQGGVS